MALLGDLDRVDSKKFTTYHVLITFHKKECAVNIEMGADEQG
jgi:hypothetical protein